MTEELFLARRNDSADPDDRIIRRVVLMRRLENSPRWLATVDPPLRGPYEKRHTEVVLWRWDDPKADIADLPSGRLFPVAIGPKRETGDGPPDAWFRGEMATTRSAWPESLSDSDRLAIVEEWVREHGNSAPPPRIISNGLNVAGAINEFKRRQFHRDLSASEESRLSRLEGWDWWDRDEIALLEDYVLSGGRLPVEADVVWLDRLVGVSALMLASRYRLTLLLGPQATAPLSMEEVRRLEAIPEWPDGVVKSG